MRHNLLSFVVLAATSLVSATGRSCRCRPSEACWPSDGEWSDLNRTTNGQVHSLIPVGNVCHGSAYDSHECNMITQESLNSTWRCNHPGKSLMMIILIRNYRNCWPDQALLTIWAAALVYTNWETWPQQNESCYLDNSKSVPCGQGRVPLYTLEAKTPQDIQAGVNFAQSHNVRLAIRNTGHSYQGRSTAPESLQINTHLMKNKTLHTNFRPSGYNGTGIIEPLAVTLDAGVQLFDMYEFCQKHGVMVVGGSSHGVGAAGGYIQGGGHSMFAGLLGMASDNALEFKVVVADVSINYDHSTQPGLTSTSGSPCYCK